jgi:hypothetical protein
VINELPNLILMLDRAFIAKAKISQYQGEKFSFARATFLRELAAGTSIVWSTSLAVEELPCLRCLKSHPWFSNEAL